MTDEDVFEVVRAAVIWAKSEVITLTPSNINPSTVLADPPIYFDSLDFVAMVTHLEEAFGMIAEDEHFSPRAMRTVGDVVGGVKRWIADPEAT